MTHLKQHVFNSATDACIYCGAERQEGHLLAIMPWNPRQTTLIGTIRAGRPRSQKTH